MARTPYFDKHGNKKGAWSKEEDNMLIAYIARYGHWNWSEIPKFAGVSRCGKSCRLRWMNYLRPNMKRGNITKEEEDSIIKLHGKFGNKWSTIAAKLPGRSDNEIKNYWNTNLRKRAKQDQLCHKTAESYNNLAKSKQNLIKNQNIEDKTSSSESSSVNTHSRSFANPSASTARMESLSSSLSDFDGSVTCNFTPRLDFENAGSFWTDPFLADVDSAPMNEYPSCLDLGQALSNDMITDDEFIWSSMNLYDGYHKQLKQ